MSAALDWLRQQVEELPVEGHWQSVACGTLRDGGALLRIGSAMRFGLFGSGFLLGRLGGLLRRIRCLQALQARSNRQQECTKQEAHEVRRFRHGEFAET